MLGPCSISSLVVLITLKQNEAAQQRVKGLLIQPYSSLCLKQVSKMNNSIWFTSQKLIQCWDISLLFMYIFESFLTLPKINKNVPPFVKHWRLESTGLTDKKRQNGWRKSCLTLVASTTVRMPNLHNHIRNPITQMKLTLSPLLRTGALVCGYPAQKS